MTNSEKSHTSTIDNKKELVTALQEIMQDGQVHNIHYIMDILRPREGRLMVSASRVAKFLPRSGCEIINRQNSEWQLRESNITF